MAWSSSWYSSDWPCCAISCLPTFCGRYLPAATQYHRCNGWWSKERKMTKKDRKTWIEQWQLTFDEDVLGNISSQSCDKTSKEKITLLWDPNNQFQPFICCNVGVLVWLWIWEKWATTEIKHLFHPYCQSEMLYLHNQHSNLKRKFSHTHTVCTVFESNVILDFYHANKHVGFLVNSNSAQKMFF